MSKTHVVVLRGLGCVALASASFLTGCSMNSGNELAANAVVSGKAMGGRQPVTGAAVSFYATGNTGYGSAATLLGTATTDGGGNFSITRNANSCADPQQVYLVAVGGDPGSGSSNTASVLVEALGPCSSITSATSGLVVNELTTVAAAYAVQGFADTTVNIGTSSTNAQGLTHAFANAANLVAADGIALTTTAGGNGVVPNNVLNGLADILASCENSSGSSSSQCTAVLQGAPAAVGAATPANVWQEALNMARYPGYQVSTLFGQVNANSPFQPTLGSTPNDLSVGIQYTAGLESDNATAAYYPWSLAADSSDNVWISGMTKANMVELSANGTVLSPNGGWGTTALQGAQYGEGIAVDKNNNVWLADSGGNIWEYAPNGTSQGTTTQYTSTLTKPYAIAVDGSNNVWYANYITAGSSSVGIGEIPSGGSPTAPPNSASSSSSTKGAYTMAVDATNDDVLVTSQSAGLIYQWIGETASSTTAAVATTSLGSSPANGVAVDKNHNVWMVYTASGASNGSISKFAEGATAATYTCKVTTSGAQGLYGPRGLAVDGNNRLFIGDYGATTNATTMLGAGIMEFDPSLGTGCGDAGNDAGTFFTTAAGNPINPSSATGGASIQPSSARNITIDHAGSLWVVNASSYPYAVVQVFGIAGPTDPVLADGKYGVRP